MTVPRDGKPSVSGRGGLNTILFVVLIITVALLTSAQYVEQGGKFSFYQMYMKSAILWSCGDDLREPAAANDELDGFVHEKSERLDCSKVATIPQIGHAGPYFYSHLYLATSAAVLWRWLGVSQSAIWLLAAVLLSGYALASYFLARIYLSGFLSGLIGVLVAVSPVSVSMLYILRDFSKAPFMVALITLCVYAWRAQRYRNALWLVLSAGLLSGVGLGFRVDVLALVPLAICSVALVPTQFPRGRRLFLSAVLLLAFCVPAAPIFEWGIGASWGTTVLQGATEPFRAHLLMPARSYDLGATYSDEVTLTGIAADLRQVDPSGYDAREATANEGISQAMLRSGQVLGNYFVIFPADVLEQALLATYGELKFFELISPARRYLDPYRSPEFVHTPLVRLTAASWLLLGRVPVWLVTAAGAWLFLALRFRRGWREGLAWSVFLTAYFGTGGLQFSLRHVFQVEPFIWLFTLGAVPFARELFVYPGNLKRLVTTGLALGGLILLMLTFNQIQAAMLRRELADVLHGPAQVVPLKETASAEGVIFKVSVPVDDQALITSPADSFTSQNENFAPVYEVRAASQRLLVSLSKKRCPSASVPISLIYQTSANTWQPLSRTISVSASDALMTSVYYRPTQYFSGFSVPAAMASCVDNIKVLQAKTRLPSLLTAEIPQH